MLVVALIMIFITVYNFFMTPDPEIEQEYINSNANHKGSFAEVFTTFFQKKQIGLILTFILVYRLGESQLIKMQSIQYNNLVSRFSKVPVKSLNWLTPI